MTRNDNQQTKLWKRIQTSNRGGVPRLRHDHSQADVRQDDQNGRALKESKEKDTSKLIVDAAERLFRQIGFQKTTVADIARELHMSPANVYRYFAAKSEIGDGRAALFVGRILMLDDKCDDRPVSSPYDRAAAEP